jgi:hypothetical protein
MVDACYVCRRTQADLNHLNEEIRTRVYLSYFSNARTQLDDVRRRITFLQRLKDEESGDPHFRINAKQVFGDPKAYEKLMPWIDNLIEIARASSITADDRRSIGDLVEVLLEETRDAATKMEQGLNQIRSGFATGGTAPLSLEPVTRELPVDWSLDGSPFAWHGSQTSDREPLRRAPNAPRSSVEVHVHICTLCRVLTTTP